MPGWNPHPQAKHANYRDLVQCPSPPRQKAALTNATAELYASAAHRRKIWSIQNLLLVHFPSASHTHKARADSVWLLGHTSLAVTYLWIQLVLIISNCRPSNWGSWLHHGLRIRDPSCPFPLSRNLTFHGSWWFDAGLPPPLWGVITLQR